MPVLDDLPSALVIPGRADIIDRYGRDVRLRNPEAVVVPGTKEYADAAAFADQVVPLYFDAKTIGDFVADVNKANAALSAVLQAAGTDFLPAAGGSGYVTITASVGGGTIVFGDQLRDPVTGFRYQCTATGLYTDGAEVPVLGIDTGPLTNLAAGTVLQWIAPRPGIGVNAIIAEQHDGSGLSGGRDAETNNEAYARLVSLRRSPPASGNDAQFQAAVAETPAITVQQCFTYPCIIGPGSIGITFTLRPGRPGGSRVPNPAQLAAVLAWLVGQFPADDSILMVSLLDQPVDLYLEVLWAQGAVGWADVAPWPDYIPGDIVKIDGAVTPTPTSFRLTTGTSARTPKIGQTICFYDAIFGVFRKKRILTVSVVSAGLSWDITVDTTNASSDVGYTPLVGQAASPWSESLAGIVPPIASYFDGLGPGEQIDPLPDPGLRKRRSPPHPTTYSHQITNRLISSVFDVATVGDVELLSPSVPFGTTVGTPGIVSYLLSLGNIAVFAE